MEHWSKMGKVIYEILWINMLASEAIPFPCFILSFRFLQFLCRHCDKIFVSLLAQGNFNVNYTHLPRPHKTFQKRAQDSLKHLRLSALQQLLVAFSR